MLRFELFWVSGDSEELVDEYLDLSEFYADNDLDAVDISGIEALAVGEAHYMGGGAAPVFGVRRLA